MSDQLALKVEELKKCFAGLAVLERVCFQIRDGERFGVVGANGSGKSTLMKIIGGWLAADTGCVRLFGHDVTRWSSHRRYLLPVREVPQFPRVCGELTVFETIAIAQHASRIVDRAWLQGRQQFTRMTSSEKWAELVPANPVCRLSELAFGAQKLAIIASAMAARPRLLLLDEPTAGLDKYERTALAAAVNSNSDCAVFVIEHDPSFLDAIGADAVELRDGVLL